jgi:Mrp family chromosome partitioning ATPase
MSLADAGARVLLLEADFDQPQLHQVMSVTAPVGAGFSQQIIARKHGVPSRPWVVVRCSHSLQVLAEGRVRSPGILALHEFGHAIRELGELHHVLVMHAPSLDKPSDLRALDELAQVTVLAQPDQPPAIHFGHQPLRQLIEPTRG